MPTKYKHGRMNLLFTLVDKMKMSTAELIALVLSPGKKLVSTFTSGPDGLTGMGIVKTPPPNRPPLKAMVDVITK